MNITTYGIEKESLDALLSEGGFGTTTTFAACSQVSPSATRSAL